MRLMALLSSSELDSNLKTLDGWTREGNALRKQFTFAGFPEAVAFVQRLVPEAEAADHHPDITINYRRVTLSWSTHSEGGITMKDIDGARMADRRAREHA
jgi:4a-hydroxytetrahydrobiopterin dehydratase